MGVVLGGNMEVTGALSNVWSRGPETGFGEILRILQ